MSKRHFGTLRRRSSGRWQAIYVHEGRVHNAPQTFATKSDALAFLSITEADIRSGAWIDPRAGKTSVRSYADEWLERRPDLAVRTKELYRYLLDSHILPELGADSLASFAPSKVRGWHAKLAQAHPSTAAKAYRLLATIMRTAATDGLLLVSPCRVAGGGTERAAERPIASLAEVDALAAAMPERLQLVVLLTTWCQLRRGELLGLRRRDIDALGESLTIERSRTFTRKGNSLVKEPKSAAGHRILAIPPNVLDAIQEHLERFTSPSPDAFVFTGMTGVPLTAGVLQKAWAKARLAIGRTDLHLHDLRHSVLTLAAATGATTAAPVTLRRTLRSGINTRRRTATACSLQLSRSSRRRQRSCQSSAPKGSDHAQIVPKHFLGPSFLPK